MTHALDQSRLSNGVEHAGDDSPLDEGALANLRQLDPDGADNLLASIVRTYLGTVPQEILLMHEALQRQDGTALRMAAHSMKSSSGYVGALGVRELCRELENCGRESRLEAAKSVHAELLAEYARVEPALRKLLGEKH